MPPAGRRILRLGWVLACILIGPTHGLSAQADGIREQSVQQLCHAPEEAGNEAAMVRAIDSRLHAIATGGRRIHLAVVDGGEFQFHDAANFALICVPKAAVNFFGDAEGELAFLIANEIGHLLDDACRSPAGRRAVAHSLNDTMQNSACEMRADELAFSMITHAGYNPASAAGALGRLQMFQGVHKDGDQAAALNEYAATAASHPVTPERITHLRKLLEKSLLPPAQ